MNTSKTIEPEIIINPNTKTIQIPQELYNICVATDDNSEIIRIRVPRYFDDYDFSTKDCTITYNNALKERGIYTVTKKKVFENSILLYWCISNHVTKKAGKIHFVVEFKSSNAEHNKTYSWSTTPAELNILPWLDENVTYGGEEDNSAIEYIKLSSHKHGNMNILNKITQSMLDLIDLIKPAYDKVIAHISKISDLNGDGMHLPPGGEIGQVLGIVGNEHSHKWINNTNVESNTSDYSILINKPSINGIELVGNKTSTELGINVSQVNVPTKVSQLENDSKFVTQDSLSNSLKKKIDSVDGMGLSQENFESADKEKLKNLPEIIICNANTIPENIPENTLVFIYDDEVSV